MDEQTIQAPPNPPPETSTDLSKTTITVLVLLTLIISVMGTWTVMNELNSMNTAKAPPSSSRASVGLTIAQPGQNLPASSGGSASVGINIQNPQ